MQLLQLLPEAGNTTSYKVASQLYTTVEEEVEIYAFHTRLYKNAVLAVCLKDASALQYTNTFDTSGKFTVGTFPYPQTIYPGMIANVHTEAKPRVYGVLAIYSPQ